MDECIRHQSASNLLLELTNLKVFNYSSNNIELCLNYIINISGQNSFRIQGNTCCTLK